MTAATARQLTAYLDSIDGSKPFCWQTNNCSHFAAGWWRVATGADPLLGLAMPVSAASAPRWLYRQGTSFADLVAARLKRPRINPLQAQAGDLVIVSAVGCGAGGVGAALGVCTGRLVTMLGTDGQLMRLPMAAAMDAFALTEVLA